MKYFLILIACLACLAFVFTRVKEQPKTASGNLQYAMADAARKFLGTLTQEQKEDLQFPFNSDERTNWHYIPRERKGLLWATLNHDQRSAAIDLMKTALSEEGYRKTREIMKLEGVLRELENRPANDTHRDPEKYFFSLFGSPDDHPWGWRFEGHHLSWNFTSVTGELTAVTPAFLGTNPARVELESTGTLEVLKEEQALGRSFVQSLTSDQWEKASLSPYAPDDVLTGAEVVVSLTKYEGLPAREMTEVQRKQFRQLLAIYIDKLSPELAEKQWEYVKNDDLNNYYFAWAGSKAPGERHYYRIHGPSLLIEYDNTQNNANHVHTVMRSKDNDFGRDLLREHYHQADDTHGHSH